MDAELYELLIRETDEMRKELKKMKEDIIKSSLKQRDINFHVRKPYDLNHQNEFIINK